jgi:hypothetical protein
MLVIQVFVTGFFNVGNFSPPSLLFQECFKAKNGIFAVVVPVDVVGIFNKLDVFDDPPAVSVTDVGDVPSGGVTSGYGLTQFNCLGHRTSFERKKATYRDDRPPVDWLYGWRSD